LDRKGSVEAMKIAMITQYYIPDFPKGGLNRYCCEVIPRLVNRGHEVKVIYRTKHKRHIGTFLWIIKNALLIPQVDIIHAQNFRSALIPYIARKKYILHAHDLGPQDLYFIRGWLQRKMIKNATHIVSPSNAVKDRIIQEIGIDERNISVIHNGIDTDTFKLLNKKREGIGFIGREAAYKASIIPKLEEKLSKKINRPQSTLSEDELIDYYNRHELIIVPSQVGEGFSFVTLEALVCGCKVVASGLPAIKEVAREYAVYAKPGDVDDFTKKILYTLRSPRKQVNEIRKYVQECLSWTNHIEKLIEVYKKNIARA